MKIILSLLFILPLLAISQSAQSFKKLPENNEVVQLALKCYNQTLNSDSTGVIQYLDTSKTSIKKFLNYSKILINFNPEDTIMIENYGSNEKTSIRFRIRLNDDIKTPDYWVKTTSNGISGSTKDFTFWIEEDKKFKKVENLIFGK